MFGMPFGYCLFVKGSYEESRCCGGSYTTPVGSAIITNLDGAFSADRALPDPHQVSEFFTVSGSDRTRRNLCSSAAAGYPRIT